jgi:hypothetical protein
MTSSLEFSSSDFKEETKTQELPFQRKTERKLSKFKPTENRPTEFEDGEDDSKIKDHASSLD